LAQVDHDEYTNSFAEGALAMCMGIVNEEEKIRGMFEFACWYEALLKKEGYDSP